MSESNRPQMTKEKRNYAYSDISVQGNGRTQIYVSGNPEPAFGSRMGKNLMIGSLDGGQDFG